MKDGDKSLSQRLAGLRPEQRALFELKLRRMKQERALEIPRPPRRERAPLSLDQERLWLIQQLDLDSPAYNIYSGTRFTGRLNLALFRQSLQDVVRRHEIMRTRFEESDGKPVQVIQSHLDVGIPLVDLRGLPLSRREDAAEELANDEVARPFDLTRPPLFRVTLFQVADDQFICTSVFHHIITDWVSFHQFKRELALLYEAKLSGRPAVLPELPVQYADFAAWQRERSQQRPAHSHLEYWKRHLADAPQALDLPSDRPRPPTRRHRGARRPLVLSRELSDRVRWVARQEGVTLFIAMLAAFKCLIHRLTGRRRIIVGSPIANRNHGQLEHLLGFFLNQLVFYTVLDGNLSFREVVRRVRKTATEAYAHQEAPFAQIVQEIQPRRDLSRPALTPFVLLFLDPQGQPDAQFPGLKVSSYLVDGRSSKFDMTFSMWDDPKGFAGWMEYDADLFDAPTIIRMSRCFRCFLSEATAHPDRPIGRINLLSPSERHQLVREWNDTARAGASESTVVELFEKRVATSPRAPAVISHDEVLSFEELNRRANRLAAALQRMAAGPETRVGLLTERSAHAVVGLLGALKGGGAYVALDPNWPEIRLRFVLRDAGIEAVLAEEHLIGLLPEGPAVVPLGPDLPGEAEDERNPPPAARPDNLCYLIYTSGSSGVPKAVMVEHRSVVHLADALGKTVYRNRAAGLRVSLNAPLTFDSSVKQWVQLLHGHALSVVSAETRSDLAALLESARRRALNVLDCTPGQLRPMLSHRWPKSLHTVLVAGEALEETTWARMRQLERPMFFNLYGLTECTVDSTWAPVNSSPLPTLGRPLPSTRVYVLGPEMSPVPIGVAGQLFVGGRGVSRGYRGRPALTAARFAPDPFSAEPGARMYRTGDAARLLSDGRLQFLGRLDDQLKIRGFRVEPGEIEAHLKRRPQINGAAVLAVEGKAGQKQLAAFVASASPPPDAGDLQRHVRRHLPDYMTPSRFVFLEELPLTARGKVDRRALRELELHQPISSPFAPPATPNEKILCEIWREALRLDRVGVNDDFFALGGDSILSMQVVSRARRRGLGLHPKDLFQSPTIRQLAALASEAGKPEAEQGPVTGPAPLAAVQARFFASQSIDPHHFNQALLFRLDPSVKPAAVKKTFDALLLHHDALRMRFHGSEDGWSQFNEAPSDEAVFKCLDLSELPEPSRRLAFERAAERLQSSLDLARGPLIRAALFHPGEAEPPRLLVIVHHLVVDRVSWNILLEDFERGCRQILSGRSIQLPPKTASYRQWRREQSAQDARWDGEERWWERTLDREAARLPVDHPEGVNQWASADHVQTRLSRDETAALLDQSKRFESGAQEAILAALLEAAAPWTGRRRLLIELEGHGRHSPNLDLSRTVGWFTSIFPVLLEAPAGPIESTLRSVSGALQAIPNQGLGYGVLRYLKNNPALCDGPEAPVVFNYLGRLDRALSKDSLLSPEAGEIGPVRSPRSLRTRLLEITAAVIGGRLQLTWTYSRCLHRPETIRTLARDHLEALRKLLGKASALSKSSPSENLSALAKKDLSAVASAKEGPLSLAQESPWSVHQLVPENAVFNHAAALSLRGSLDLKSLSRAVAEIMRRHHSLRTTFHSKDGRPFQRVGKVGPARLRVVDLEALPEGERQLEARLLSLLEANSPFNLEKGPLIRKTLVRLSPDEHRLLITVHHIVSDAWSMGIFTGELARLYEAFSRGAPSPLPELKIQYAEYAREERKRLTRVRLEKGIEFWKRRLAPPLEPLNLPADFPRGDRPSFETSTLAFGVDGNVSARFRRLARRCGVSLFSALTAGLNIALHRWSGSVDIRVGTLVSTRDRAELEQLIGLFVNTLVIRSDLSGDPTGEKVLRQTHRAVAEAWAHWEVPFQWQLEALQGPDFNPAALFEVLFVFHNVPIQPLRLPGLEVSVATDESGLQRAVTGTTCDLVLMMSDGSDGLRGHFQYKTGLFKREAMEAFAKRFRRTLGELAAHPERNLSEKWP